jgi:hypothetical protein
MKKTSLVILGLVLTFGFALGIQMEQKVQAEQKLMDEQLEYEVMSIIPHTWIVTAKQTATGNLVKFKLPPAVFVGKTFDAQMMNVKVGERFDVKGPRNVRLDNLLAEEIPERGRRRLRRAADKPRLAFLKVGEPLNWEILEVNAQTWEVKAKNIQGVKTMTFKVDPQAFAGFKFYADLTKISKGQGFSIVTPNNLPISDACTLIKID